MTSTIVLMIMYHLHIKIHSLEANPKFEACLILFVHQDIPGIGDERVEITEQVRNHKQESNVYRSNNCKYIFQHIYIYK